MIVSERIDTSPALAASVARPAVAYEALTQALTQERIAHEAELTVWHALGGLRGWLGVLLTIAFVAFPMGSSLAPVVKHWWPAATSLTGVMALAMLLWTLGLAWCLQAVLRQLENERRHLVAW